MPYWGRYAGGGLIVPSSPGLAFPGLAKPQIVPTIDYSNPLTVGLLTYMFDTGGGIYVDLAGGRTVANIPSSTDMSPPAAIVNGTSVCGTASLWPGLTIQGGGGGSPSQPGVCALIQLGNTGGITGPDPIAVANDLLDYGVGVGNTLACGIQRIPGLIVNEFSMIFGRPGVSAADNFPNNPWLDWLFWQGGDTNSITASCLSGASAFQTQVGSAYSCPDNAFTSLLMTCQNASAGPGTGTATFAVNGASNGTTTGVSMYSDDPDVIAETDLMIGCTKHMQTYDAYNFWGGYIFYGAVWTRMLSLTEWASLHANPWQFLK